MQTSLIKVPTQALGLDMISFLEPLGLECVAGALEAAGHGCSILDLRIDGVDAGLERLRREGPGLIGVQCSFTTERLAAVALLGRLRERHPAAVLVVGGHDASREPEFLAGSAADAIVVGDGEAVVPGLADAIDRGRPLDGVPGLCLVTDDGVRSTGPAATEGDADRWPMPARHLMRRYADRYYVNFERPFALLETARGCPFTCTFCSVWKFHGGCVRAKSPARVVAELDGIPGRNVFITDDIFWLEPKRGRALGEAVLAAGRERFFKVQTRADIICRHPQLVELWRRCGPLGIFLGLEAVDDRGLAAVNKRTDAATNQRAVDILRDLDVGYTPNFLVDPDWGPEEFRTLREWIERNGLYNSGFTVLTPLPGTDLWDTARERVTTTNWDLYDLIHAVVPTRLPLAEFYREYAGLWRAVLELRFRHRGRVRTYLQLVAAVGAGRVSLSAVRRGMMLGRVFSDPETFLAGHREQRTETVQA